MPIIPDGIPNIWDVENGISERLQSSSPGGASFSYDGNSRASMTYIIDGFGTALDSSGPLVIFCNQALGTVNIDDTDGSLTRTPPMAHPQYRWLYADKISSIKGIGLLRSDEEDPNSPLISFPTDAQNSYQLTAPYFAVYKKYEVVVEFGPRPYLPIGDQAMNLLEDEFPNEYQIVDDTVYHKDNGEAVTIDGNPYREYMRFTTFTSETSAEYMTLKGGAMQFVSDYDGDPQGTLKIDGVEIPGFFGKTLLPKTTLKMTWFDVPYAFVDPTQWASTNIYQALGRVNQHWFYGYAPGELLFVGFSNNQKMRNQFDQWDYTSAEYLPQLHQTLLTDITFQFLYIPIKSYDKTGNIYPESPTGIVNPDNESYVNAGHNLAMFSGNKQYYPVVSKDLTGDKSPPAQYRKKPIYGSYPFELMFNAKPYIMAIDPTE
jgi:hypothetical protein